MASSRPRRAASQPASVPANIRSGLKSICVGNEALITAMLGAEKNGRQDSTLHEKLAQVMAVNSLSPEQMLARFFDTGMLGEYCMRLGKSDKGAVATLAARIAKEWSRPDFGQGIEHEEVPGEVAAPTAPAASYKQPTWLELQTDSDDDDDEAQRKKDLKAAMRRAKAGAGGESRALSAGVGAPAAGQVSPKRRKLDAAGAASVLSRAAYDDEGEAPAAFNTAHYGAEGLNGRFEMEGAIEMFAGGEEGGGGRFEDAESRDIAKNAEALVRVMQAHGLCRGATCIDVGAGTGLMLRKLSEAVGTGGEDGGEEGGEDGGDGGHVIAIDVSSRFVQYLQRRVPKERLANVTVQRCTPRATSLPAGTGASFACLLDVYHHLEYPITFMRSLADALYEGGRVLVCDFHRDPARVTSMPPEWALEHIRADQSTFRAEIERSGFRLVANPELPELTENYLMVFEKACT